MSGMCVQSLYFPYGDVPFKDDFCKKYWKLDFQLSQGNAA